MSIIVDLSAPVSFLYAYRSAVDAEIRMNFHQRLSDFTEMKEGSLSQRSVHGTPSFGHIARNLVRYGLGQEILEADVDVTGAEENSGLSSVKIARMTMILNTI